MNFLRILALLTLTSMSSGQCVQGTTCLSGICNFDFCICASGVTGVDCSSKTTVCSNWGNVSNLVTDNYPTLDLLNGGIQQGNLKIYVTSPLVANRLS